MTHKYINVTSPINVKQAMNADCKLVNLLLIKYINCILLLFLLLSVPKVV